MEDLSTFDKIILTIWLMTFSILFLISAQAVIRDHCRRVQVKRKRKLRSKKNETLLR